MTTHQILVFVILGATMLAFVWARWRYDLVAVTALLVAVFVGVVPREQAFSGFAHPAVITVAAVLMISRALQSSGVVDGLANILARTRHTTTLQIGANNVVTAIFSGFMNNVGALALMMPVALRNCSRSHCGPSMLLMPMSFASLLGGLVTLIGTPPNIIIATFRAEATGEPFAMFDFAAVGLPVALVGLAFISFVGWRLLPRQETAGAQNVDRFHINRYVSQATLPGNSDLVGQTVREIENLCGNEVTVMAIIRGRRRMLAPAGNTAFEADDILLLEGDTAALQPLFDATGLVHVGAESVAPNDLETAQVRMVEVVVIPGSAIEGSSMRGLKMHEHFGINLLAMSREGGHRSFALVACDSK